MITVILNAYKRTNFLANQIEAIEKQTIKPTKIMVWQNYAEKVDQQIKERCIFAECNHNLGVWARFAFAINADTKYVCIFDDDTIPGPRWFENCLQTIKKYPGLIGARGVRFRSNKRYFPYDSVGWDNPNELTEKVDIVGHSWFFEREWLATFWRELPPLDASKLAGEDMHFSYTLQKYLSLNTYVAPHPTDCLELWGSQPDIGRKLGTDAAAISVSDQGMSKFNIALEHYVKNGFSLCCDNDNSNEFRLKKQIYVGKGLASNPTLRKLVNKYKIFKYFGKIIINFASKLGIVL